MKIKERLNALLHGKQAAAPSTRAVKEQSSAPLPELSSAEDAWAFFCSRLGLPDTTEEHEPADRSLAAFARAHPGAFEQRLLAGLSELAQRARPDGQYRESELEYFLDGFRYFRQTMEAIEPRAGLLMLAEVNRCHCTSEDAFLSLHAAYRDGGELFARRLGVELLDTLDLPGGMRDALRSRITGDPLPDILPARLDDLSPDDIAALFEAHGGLSIAALEQRLLPGQASESGFLAPGERLGEVIAADARRLRELGVSRHALADRLELGLSWHERPSERLAALPETSDRFGEFRASAARVAELARNAGLEGEDDAPFEVEQVIHYKGFQEDPFVWGRHRASNDFVIRSRRHPHLRIKGSALMVPLIRCACFFEGRVRHRVDPELAARVLGLLA
ncbi:hypothetical protein WME89_24875 [Sorangium sp. So ce321]|uniref:hypothetical protein n=1 Tax=Sorangium sp. So ce321 TaxID=3133300 RepID=UPI003F62FCA0